MYDKICDIFAKNKKLSIIVLLLLLIFLFFMFYADTVTVTSGSSTGTVIYKHGFIKFLGVGTYEIEYVMRNNGGSYRSPGTLYVIKDEEGKKHYIVEYYYEEAGYNLKTNRFQITDYIS